MWVKKKIGTKDNVFSFKVYRDNKYETHKRNGG